MIRLYKRIIGWLKTIFKGEDMSFEFPELGDEYLAKVENDIGAKKNGKIDGSNNRPRTESNKLSNCEEEATIKIDNKRNEGVKKAAEYLKPKKRVIAETQQELDQTHYYFEQFENTIRKTYFRKRVLKNVFSTDLLRFLKTQKVRILVCNVDS